MQLSLLWSVCSTLLPIFLLICDGFWTQAVCGIYVLAFFPKVTFLFILFTVSFNEEKSLNEIPFIYLFIWSIMFLKYLRNICFSQDHEAIYYSVFKKLYLSLRSMIQLKQICVCGMRWETRFCSPVWIIHLIQPYLLKRLYPALYYRGSFAIN